ncbi:hypothetical protein BZA05DRAFT_275056 [Tricharina praecox]|uniref:uncharacterized protein n=1 Tax=Tricharina praecox TaxID=43433 RepID=UPI00221FC195|nr:uncharacterized protein BZA05DRAFT_275056 [Tricharina praecox]KAI5853942.1 hypothetical protein BZA05DRAFT_275056 [Tricharina praecox]
MTGMGFKGSCFYLFSFEYLGLLGFLFCSFLVFGWKVVGKPVCLSVAMSVSVLRCLCLCLCLCFPMGVGVGAELHHTYLLSIILRRTIHTVPFHFVSSRSYTGTGIPTYELHGVHVVCSVRTIRST